jgi:hypothetical protein
MGALIWVLFVFASAWLRWDDIHFHCVFAGDALLARSGAPLATTMTDGLGCIQNGVFVCTINEASVYGPSCVPSVDMYIYIYIYEQPSVHTQLGFLCAP